MDNKILEQLEETFAEEITLAGNDLGSLEMLLKEKLQLLGKGLLQHLDGTTVHETDGWHETKIGMLYWENECKKRENRYVDRFETSETFDWHLWLEAFKCAFRQSQEVVYLVDGAPWIRTEFHRHFGRATFIIDWYHASEHIWDCGKELYGEGTEATKRWVHNRLSLLWDGWTKKLLDNLREQRKKYRNLKRDAIDVLIRYGRKKPLAA